MERLNRLNSGTLLDPRDITASARASPAWGSSQESSYPVLSFGLKEETAIHLRLKQGSTPLPMEKQTLGCLSIERHGTALNCGHSALLLYLIKV